MDEAEVAERAARWRADLLAWAIPEEIMAKAPADPWAHAPARFARRTDALLAEPSGPTYERCAQALPSGGSVLDVGAGTGAASLPLPAAELIAVDESARMLAELGRRAAARGLPARLVEGRWPDVADEVPEADVVVCAHVVFNVPALHAHARRRVVLELPELHPTSWLGPLWLRFHGLRRPSTPTYEDVVAIVAALGHPLRVTRHLSASPLHESYEELAASACRRLCLDPARAEEVAEAARELGVTPGRRRPFVTLWWDAAGG
jgi:SAM-dependent methyltransferase